MTCAVILICTVAPLVLRAQVDPCKDLWEPKSTPATTPAKNTPETIEDQTKAALAEEWKKPDGAKQLLEVLELLTASMDLRSGPRNKVNKQVLAELTNGDPKHKDLYRSAMGNLDEDGYPRVPPPVNLLDALSKANTLTKPTDEDQKSVYDARLFACTQKLINNMCAPDLVDINYYFAQKNDHNYVALYQLLKARPCDKEHDADKQNFLKELEILRAAFDDNTDLLAKRVAARISTKK